MEASNELIEESVKESLKEDYLKSLEDWVCTSRISYKLLKAASCFKENFNVLYRYVARPWDDYYKENNVWSLKEGDIFSATPCSSSILQFLSKENYDSFVDKITVFTSQNSDADICEMVFHNAEGWKIPDSVYDITSQWSDSDYRWQQEVILDGRYKVTKVIEINDKDRPTLKRRVELTSF